MKAKSLSLQLLLAVAIGAAKAARTVCTLRSRLRAKDHCFILTPFGLFLGGNFFENRAIEKSPGYFRCQKTPVQSIV